MPKREGNDRAYTPPASIEAEQSVLGSILVRPSGLDDVVDLLHPDDFYRQAHGHIFRAMLDLYGRSEPVDIITVSFLLKERGQLDGVGGHVFLAALSEETGFATNIIFYAKLVKDKATLRRTLDISQEIAGACLGPIENVPEFLDAAEQKIFEVAHEQKKSDMVHLKALSQANYVFQEDLHERKAEAHGLLTGFYDYDRLTAGLHIGEVTILAARPGMGKTALCLNIAWNVGEREPVALFSLEMEKERQLTNRLVASAGRIDGDNLRRGRMNGEAWAKREKIQARLDECLIWIDDTPGLTPLQLRAKCRRLKARQGLSLVIVDYLQLMKVPRMRSRDEEVSHIAYALKELSKELSVPVLVACQVNREVEKRSGRKYQLSDLRESGAIEQAADNVLFLYRDKEDVIGELDLAKQRNGAVGTFKLAYSAAYARFDNYAR
jgi:replicative DNA helicase